MKPNPLYSKLRLSALLLLLAFNSNAQINLSGGAYNQDFDALLNTGTANAWADNSTIPGWYAARAGGTGASGPFPTYRAGTGSDTAGAIYSFGTASATDRCLGTVASGTTGTNAFGLRLVNDTATGQTNFTISYTGEQWRSGGNTSPHRLFFAYRIDNTAITDLDPLDAASVWTYVSALDFVSPIIGGSAGALDGNAAANRQSLNVVLPGVAVAPGQELFLRWRDFNDAGNDHGFGVDDLSITFTPVTIVTTPASITSHPTSVTVAEGSSATFSVTASGTQPISYQWYSTNAGSSSEISGAVNSSFTTNSVTTSLSGHGFFVVVGNSYGSATSTVATLTVTNVIPVATNIHYLHTLHNANYVLTNTTTLFQAEGVVTTPANLVSGTSVYSFHIQDATGGIDVFNRGGFANNLPSVGTRVRVTAPLAQFDGLLELLPVSSNPTHKIEVLNDGATEPLPTPFHFTFSSIDIQAMEETFEGAYVVVSNVYLAVTNADGRIAPGGKVFMTNLTGQVFTLYNPTTAVDPQGNFPPQFAASVKGVMGQSTKSAIPTNGYDIVLTLFSDIEAGTVPPPSVPLTITKSGSDILISWSTDSTGFVLQSKDTLGTGTWVDVTETPSVSGANYVLTVSSPTGTKFYRLRN